jgi:hypothetical protein
MTNECLLAEVQRLTREVSRLRGIEAAAVEAADYLEAAIDDMQTITVRQQFRRDRARTSLVALRAALEAGKEEKP